MTDPAERPTPAAQLKIEVQPTRVTAEGTVPFAETSHFIGAFGILTCVTMGIAGAVLTLRVSSSLTVLAMAELGLAFVGAALIALSRQARTPGQSGQAEGRMPE